MEHLKKKRGEGFHYGGYMGNDYYRWKIALEESNDYISGAECLIIIIIVF